MKKLQASLQAAATAAYGSVQTYARLEPVKFWRWVRISLAAAFGYIGYELDPDALELILLLLSGVVGVDVVTSSINREQVTPVEPSEKVDPTLPEAEVE